MLNEIKKLSDTEKLQLINEILESMENPNDLPVTNEQKNILDERLKDFEKNQITHK